MVQSYRQVLTATLLTVGLAACTRPTVPAPPLDAFATAVQEARRVAADEGFAAALPLYMQAIAGEPQSERAQLLRYQLAIAWLDKGEVGVALDLLTAILAVDDQHPLALPLYRQYADDVSAAVAAPDVATAPTAAGTPPSMVGRASVYRPPAAAVSRVPDFVRVLVPREGMTWQVVFRQAVYADGQAIKVPQHSTIALLARGAPRTLAAAGGGPLALSIDDWQGVGRIHVLGAGRVALELDLDAYLGGVVSTEMSPSWHPQALRAQAVAARTYVVKAVAEAPRERGYDLRGDVLDQAFKPQTVAAVVDAVATTHGQILTHQGRPATVFFSADNGGISEDPRFVWGFRLPYYAIRKDPFSDRVPPWTATLNVADVAQKLRLPPPVQLTLQRGPSGRVAALVWVDATGKQRRVRGNDFRLAVGPRHVRSLLFDADLRGDRLVLSGSGYGHGVGMSQWGAKTMAERGLDYKQILAYYYPGTVLATMASHAASVLP